MLSPRARNIDPDRSWERTLQHVVSALQKLAATRNCAAVVLTQCATKMQAESGATLVPAINANVWEQGVSTRLVVFKDWAWKDGSPSTVCLAGVQKLEGRAGSEAVSSAAAFRIEAAGLIALEYDASQPSVVLTSTPRRKRKLDDAGLEVPDSDEGEGDYGWEVDDDAAAPVPPQTQGSEDLLLGVNHGLYNEDDGESDDDEAGGDRVVLDSEDDGGLVNDRDSGDGSEAEDELGPGPGHGQQGGLDGASAGPDSQGSEDLLLGVNHGLYDEDDGENDDDEAGGDRVVQDSEDDGGLVNDRDSGDGSEAEDELGPGPGHGQQGGLDGASAGPDSLNSGTDRR
ncbi:hypothetical protein BN1723_009488 [Verticillium longisporum]|uniref:DNA recombination and repair protein Rad51-like C-terminal domain-containing protein n=1 Tax=Verticillium longisporum TaxID=100787 RepID=A0A0G4KPU3_VERLO|nr:hypothetical protein BN1723_009488 [Verticillium longisporum]